MGSASSKKKEPLLQEEAVSSFTSVEKAFRIAKELRRNFDLKGNLLENKEWMLHSTIFLKEGSTVRTEVEEAFDILEEAGKGSGFRFNSDLEDLTVGPALSYAFKANYVTWGFFVAMAFVGNYLVHVDKDHGLATPPQGWRLLSLLALLVVYLGASLYYELCAAYHVLPTQGCAVDREAVGHNDISKNEEKLCGGPLKFDKWMTLMLLLSVCFHFDIYTASIFVGRVRRSVGYCGALELHWQEVLYDSPLLNAVAGHFTFEGIVLFAWFGMLCQFLFALMFSMPFQRKRVEYEVVKTIGEIEKYHTLLKADQTHGRALQALADSGRMNCLNWQDDYYLEEAEAEWPLQEVAREMRRVNVRFFLFALQALLFPNLQVTFLGMQKVANACEKKSGSDWLTVTSIAVSVLSGLHYIYYERNHLKFHYGKFKAAHEASVKGKKTRREADGTVDIQYYWKRAQFSLRFSTVVCFIFVPLFLLLFVKTYMAMTVCESGVWNAKFFDSSHGNFNWTAGCVPLKHFQCNVRCAEGA